MLRITPTLFALAVALVLLTAADSSAGKYNPTLSIGDASPTWTKLPGTDGKEHSFADLQDKKVIVLFFTCNSCEYAIDYEDRIIATASKYSGEDSQVAFVGVNVNLIAADNLDAMKAKAEQKKFPFVYLFDKSQQIAKDFGGSTTPEFFVFDQDRKLVYMGSLDDNTDAKKAKVNFVEEAITATLAGKAPATTETVPIGCLIRYDRRRNRGQ
jgi:peroxiredoxin